MGRLSEEQTVVDGFVAEGYENVREYFDALTAKGHFSRGQLCVYSKGQVVVDLCGKFISQTGYDRDSLQLLFR